MQQRPDLSRVELRQGLAHELEFLQDGSVDLVILNSVVQYFPSVTYFLKVLAQAVRVTREGGHIFLGDVRNLALLDAFAASVQLHKAPGSMTSERLRQLVLQSTQKEEELLLDAGIFQELARRWPRIGRASVALKAGDYDNELSRYRYDVTLSIGPKYHSSATGRMARMGQRWRVAARVTRAICATAAKVRSEFVEFLTPAYQVRLQRCGCCQVRAVLMLARFKRPRNRRRGEHPNTVVQLSHELGVDLAWQGFRNDGIYDAIFNPGWDPSEKLRGCVR